jgi:hypothetical protein
VTLPIRPRIGQIAIPPIQTRNQRINARHHMPP